MLLNTLFKVSTSVFNVLGAAESGGGGAATTGTGNGTVASFCEQTASIWRLIGNVIRIIQILIPVALVLWGLIDLGKAVLAGDEKERKEATSTLLKRFLYGVLVFFVVAIVKGVVNLAGKGSDLKEVCFVCATSPTSDECTNAVASSGN